MRTRQQERARFGWMTPRAFGDQVGVEEEQVRQYIGEGWFRKDQDIPECINVARPNAKRPEYRIHPSAVKRFLRERAA